MKHKRGGTSTAVSFEMDTKRKQGRRRLTIENTNGKKRSH